MKRSYTKVVSVLRQASLFCLVKCVLLTLLLASTLAVNVQALAQSCHRMRVIFCTKNISFLDYAR